MPDNNPIKVINVFSSSVDLEWNVSSTFLKYKVSVVNKAKIFDITNHITDTNKISIFNLTAPEYRFRLFGVKRTECNLKTAATDDLSTFKNVKLSSMIYFILFFFLLHFKIFLNTYIR